MGKLYYINGIPYMVKLPTGGFMKKGHIDNQWDQMISCLNYKGECLDSIIHWSTMFSWCQESEYEKDVPFPQRLCSIRGYYSSTCSRYNKSDRWNLSIGFRPIFIPLNGNTLQPDPSILDELANGQCIHLGSLYLDETIIRPPQNPTKDGDIPDYLPGKEIRFGSLKSGYGFQAVKINDWLIADRVLIKNISWDDLKDLGYAD